MTEILLKVALITIKQANKQLNIECYLIAVFVQSRELPNVNVGWLVLWCLTPLSTIFQLYRGAECE